MRTRECNSDGSGFSPKSAVEESVLETDFLEGVVVENGDAN